MDNNRDIFKLRRKTLRIVMKIHEFVHYLLNTKKVMVCVKKILLKLHNCFASSNEDISDNITKKQLKFILDFIALQKALSDVNKFH